MLIVIGFLLLTILLSVLAVVIGFRGRRVGDAPTCGSCSYDLRGNPGAATCPERGADLTQAGAMVLDHRRRRVAPVVLGVTGVLLASLPLGGILVVLVIWLTR